MAENNKKLYATGFVNTEDGSTYYYQDAELRDDVINGSATVIADDEYDEDEILSVVTPSTE